HTCASRPTPRASVLERETGFEPATPSLEGWRSTAELFPQTPLRLTARTAVARARATRRLSRVSDSRAPRSGQSQPRAPPAGPHDPIRARGARYDGGEGRI